MKKKPLARRGPGRPRLAPEEKKQRRLTLLTSDQCRLLKKASETLGISQSAFVRLALEHFLEIHEAIWEHRLVRGMTIDDARRSVGEPVSTSVSLPTPVTPATLRVRLKWRTWSATFVNGFAVEVTHVAA